MEAEMSSHLTHVEAVVDAQVRPTRTLQPTRLIGLATQVLAAIRDGLTSMHHYEDLRAHGVSHVSAAKKACAFSA
jgi:hypothetical protein